jgi:hypothetical protein
MNAFSQCKKFPLPGADNREKVLQNNCRGQVYPGCHFVALALDRRRLGHKLGVRSARIDAPGCAAGG